MDYSHYFQFALALTFVVAAILALAAAARHFGLSPRVTGVRGAARRLSIVEVLSVDAKRRLILVKRDDAEYLILLGPTSDLLVDSSIRPTQPAALVPTPPQ